MIVYSRRERRNDRRNGDEGIGGRPDDSSGLRQCNWGMGSYSVIARLSVLEVLEIETLPNTGLSLKLAL